MKWWHDSYEGTGETYVIFVFSFKLKIFNITSGYQDNFIDIDNKGMTKV